MLTTTDELAAMLMAHGPKEQAAYWRQQAEELELIAKRMRNYADSVEMVYRKPYPDTAFAAYKKGNI